VSGGVIRTKAAPRKVEKGVGGPCEIDGARHLVEATCRRTAEENTSEPVRCEGVMASGSTSWLMTPARSPC